MNERILTCSASTFFAEVVSRKNGMRYCKLRLPSFSALNTTNRRHNLAGDRCKSVGQHFGLR